MSRNTTSFAVPESMRAYIAERVESGEYGNTSEYLRELIRRDQRDQEARRLRALLSAGMESGDARPVSDAVIDELRRRALPGSV